MRRVALDHARRQFHAAPSEHTAVTYMSVAYKQYERRLMNDKELNQVLVECKEFTKEGSCSGGRNTNPETP